MLTSNFIIHPLMEVSMKSGEGHSYIFSLEGGLEGLPLRVSSEGLPRPRVARAPPMLSQPLYMRLRDSAVPHLMSSLTRSSVL